MNKGIIRGLDPNAYVVSKPGGFNIISSDLNAVPLTITGENGQNTDFIDVTGFNAAAGSVFKIASNGNTTVTGSVFVAGTNAGFGTSAATILVPSIASAGNVFADAAFTDVTIRAPAGKNVRIGSSETGSPSSALSVTGVASAVNQITITAAISTAAPSIAATGTDSAIDLILNSKGSGLVNIGPASASVAVGGGATPPVLATAGIGQAGQPTTAGQNSWLEIKINGTASWIPVWR